MDIKNLMKQAHSMQKKMQEMQDEMKTKEFEGQSGGGIVSIIMTGSGEMRRVNIDPSLMRENEKEMLEDLIVAAYNDAKNKAVHPLSAWFTSISCSFKSISTSSWRPDAAAARNGSVHSLEFWYFLFMALIFFLRGSSCS